MRTLICSRSLVKEFLILVLLLLQKERNSFKKNIGQRKNLLEEKLWQIRKNIQIKRITQVFSLLLLLNSSSKSSMSFYIFLTTRFLPNYENTVILSKQLFTIRFL